MIAELAAILVSITHSDKLYFNLVKQPPTAITEAQLVEYVKMKQRRMNFQMILLIDVVGIKCDVIPKELLDMVKHSGSIQEIKAVAYKALHDIGDVKMTGKLDLYSNDSPLRNNLYVVWLVSQGSKDLARDLERTTSKVKFLEFVESMTQDQALDGNQFFDEGVFKETLEVIRQYYKVQRPV